MKKILLFLLSATFVFSMTACSTKSINSPKDTVSNTIQTENTTTEIIDELIASKTISDGSTYYHNNTWEYAREIYDFNLGEKFTSGQQMPELSTGDIYIQDGIMYVYNAEFKDGTISYIKDENINGWSARCFVNKEMSEIKFLSKIQDKPVVTLSYAFVSQELTTTLNKIVIPNTVTNISHLLSYCHVDSNIVFEINGTPTNYAECFSFDNAEVDIEKMKETGEISWYSDLVFTVTGSCDNEVKNNIARETGKISMSNITK